MTKAYDFLVFIGRFQPLHRGHLAVIEAGLEQAEHMIVLCGFAHQPRSIRNPWTASEREQMIRNAVRSEEQDRLVIAPLMDVTYNDQRWECSVQVMVNDIVAEQHGEPGRQPKVGLIGHCKNQSDYYPNLFPQWGQVTVPDFQDLSSTPVRRQYFSDEGDTYIQTNEAKEALPENVRQYLMDFRKSEAFHMLHEEHHFVEQYLKGWDAAPYEPNFVTVDAVVVQSGHVLMVERKGPYGKGLLALPGGFLDTGERILDACLRELREETCLQVPEAVLKGSIKSSKVFDDPYRSARGRTITHAFYIELAANKELPEVTGGDDAKRAIWVPLADLDPEQIFEDHYFVIQEMVAL